MTTLLDLREVYRQSHGKEVPPGTLMAVHLEIWTADRFGKILSHSLQPAHSWVTQSAQLFRNIMTRASEANIADITNTDRTMPGGPATNKMNFIAGSGVIANGIRVGTGTNAEDANDFDIQTLIADGAGVGQLEYQSSTVAAVLAVTGGYRVSVARQFINDSAGNITVEEVGAVALGNDGVADRSFLILRDLSTFTIVTGGGTATPTYQFDFLV